MFMGRSLYLKSWAKKEYEKLKEVQLSYRDKFELIDLDKDLKSKWMIDKADIVAKVRRGIYGCTWQK